MKFAFTYSTLRVLYVSVCARWCAVVYVFPCVYTVYHRLSSSLLQLREAFEQVVV